MKTSRKTSGQTLVEFALLLPLFLFLVMGLFEIGRAVLYYSVLNTAVREGTRLAIVQPSKDSIGENYVIVTPTTCDSLGSEANKKICKEIKRNLFNLGELQDSTIIIEHFQIQTGVDSNDKPIYEYYIIINISYNFEPITPGFNLIGNFKLDVNSQMLKTPLSRP